MTIREKSHRLSRECYRGRISAAVTLCIQERVKVFTDSTIVTTFIGKLQESAVKSKCIVPVYCFMPDHQHLIVTGTAAEADAWDMIVKYKQQTGFWLSRWKPGIRWQKDFYDHIIRADDGLAKHIRYILDNPVRRNLAADWKEYPPTGSIGCSLDAVLNSTV